MPVSTINAQKEQKKTVREESVQLSERDSVIFIKLIDSEDKPDEALKNAAEKYKNSISEDDFIDIPEEHFDTIR